MKGHIEKLVHDSVTLPDKRDSNRKREGMKSLGIIVIIIIIITQSISLLVLHLNEKSLLVTNEQKRQHQEAIKREMIDMNLFYDKLMNKLETFGDYKQARLRLEQSLKDKFKKVNKKGELLAQRNTVKDSEIESSFNSKDFLGRNLIKKSR